MDRALARRPLIWLLAAALVASLAALPISRAQARDLVETDTSIDLADDEPQLGDTITITAFVERLDDESGDVTGQVTFVAGTAEAGPFGTTLGQATLSGGEADLDYTVDTATLPAGTTDSFYVVAEYQGDSTFEASSSDPVRIEITPTDPADPVATTISVSVPDDSLALEDTELTATVQPAEATGTVTFLVDGASVGTADVDAGTAVLMHWFDDEGDHTVAASFAPEDPELYLPSTSSDLLVPIGPHRFAMGPIDIWSPTFHVGTGCRPAAPSSAPSGHERRIPDPFLMFFTVGFPDVTPLLTFSPFLGVFDTFKFDFLACIFGSIVIGPYAHRAPTTVPVDCNATETGYQCRFELPGPPSAITVEPSIPIPAEFAGQQIPVDATLTQVDPDGVESTVFQETTTVDVPERTSLLTTLAPSRSSVTSVRPGKAVAYRLGVQNAGIVTADKIGACVTVSKGATIKAAKGATVKGRQACWRLPSLASTKSVTRTLTVVAPKKAGELKVSAVVTPKKSQADPVRLATVLPVR